MAGSTGRHNDTGFFPIEGAGILAVVARVHQSLARYYQTKQLLNSSMLHDFGRNAEFFGIKFNGAGLTAHLTIALVWYIGIRIVEFLQLPKVRFYFPNGILSFYNILPVLRKIHCTGKYTAHTNNCNFFFHSNNSPLI